MRHYWPLGPILVFGEVLFDKFPDKLCLGGAPFNFAFHLTKLGLPVHFISSIGDDSYGKEIVNFGNRNGFPLSGVQKDPEHPTGMVQVTLDEKGSPKFEILPNRAFDFIGQNEFLNKLLVDEIPLIYFGSLAQRNPTSRKTLEYILNRCSFRSNFFVDLNLRAPFYDKELVKRNLERCDYLKISMEELEEIKKFFNLSGSVNQMGFQLLRQFKIGSLCITQGSNSNLLFDSGKEDPMICPVKSKDKIVDTVGAGDAFSAMLAFGFLAGFPRKTILDRATEFATRICGIQGALPLHDSFYEPYRFK